MPQSGGTSTPAGKRQRPKPDPPKSGLGRDYSDSVPSNRMAMTSSLDTIQIAPRNPRATRTTDSWTGSGGDELELTLLGEDERAAAANGLDVEHDGHLHASRPAKEMSSKDKRAMVLLICLCEPCFRFQVPVYMLTWVE
jgi:PAT family acetyl-CoA transporter-like MFS transporter 1